MRFLLVTDDQRCDATPECVNSSATKRGMVAIIARKRCYRLRTADVGERVLSHDDKIGDAKQQRRAADARPHCGKQDRDDARPLRDGPGDSAPRVQRGHSFVDLRSRRREHPDNGHTHIAGRPDEPLDGLAFGDPQRPPVAAACETEPRHGSAVELA
jgi:hypothetical protein